MYHFPNQPLFHHNGYPNQCPFEHGVDQQPIVHPHPYLPMPSTHYDAGTLNEVSSTHVDKTQTQVEPQPPTEAVKTKKKITNKTAVDTSSFSIEERLVAAVWVHERKRTRSSMSQVSEIKQEFRQRFGREPPAKNTLLVWERKLFSTGSVCDAPRPGRPVNRRGRLQEVSASLLRAPALSLRARAAALRLPRTTLRTILRHDLHHTTSSSSSSTRRDNTLHNTTGKQKPKRRVKAAAAPRPSPLPRPQQSVPRPPAPAAPHIHTQHYPTHPHSYT